VIGNGLYVEYSTKVRMYIQYSKIRDSASDGLAAVPQSVAQLVCAGLDGAVIVSGF
jgi:hypothetical protein